VAQLFIYQSPAKTIVVALTHSSSVSGSVSVSSSMATSDRGDDRMGGNCVEENGCLTHTSRVLFLDSESK
jgi:hypothetical protein